MPASQNISELQTFLGFIQYLGKFLKNVSEVSAPLRVLLEKDIHFHWYKPQEDSFQDLKHLVSNTPVLRYYDPKKPLTLTVDASSKGLGATHVQEGQPIAYGSRALTKSQQNYAQMEKEALAISYRYTKFYQYVFGRQLLVVSDHKPLQSIFRKPLYQAPARLQSLMLQRYDLEFVRTCLSQIPLAEPSSINLRNSICLILKLTQSATCIYLQSNLSSFNKLLKTTWIYKPYRQ